LDAEALHLDDDVTKSKQERQPRVVTRARRNLLLEQDQMDSTYFDNSLHPTFDEKERSRRQYDDTIALPQI